MSDNGRNPPRGKFDPGWNDPPQLQYNAAQPAKTKLNLNKRIAFPLQGGTSGTSTMSKPTAIVQPSPSSHPPPSMPPIAIVPPMSRVTPLTAVPDNGTLITSPTSRLESNASNEVVESDFDDADRQFCLDTLHQFIPRIQETANIRSDEVQRRINLMNQMWLSGTLTSSVQRKLHNIAQALIEENFSEAIENHRALVVDHSNMCVAWGAALRQIILTIQESGSFETTSGHGQPQTAVGNVLILAPIAPLESSGGTLGDVQHI